MGLSRGFRTARISRHFAPKPILNPGMNVANFKEQIMLRGGPKQFAQTILNEYRKLYAPPPGQLPADVADLYGYDENRLMRPQPPDDSMDWVRDCLGVDFDGPTAWDRFMNLHTSNPGRTAVVANLDGSTRRGYRGWLADLCDAGSGTRQSRDIADGPIQVALVDAAMATAYVAWHTPNTKFTLIQITEANRPSLNTLARRVSGNPVNDALEEFCEKVFGTNASEHTAYILENAVCDGRCGVLGRLIEKVDARTAVRYAVEPYLTLSLPTGTEQRRSGSRSSWSPRS